MKQYNYKVVGVTFPARDGSDRQESLKDLFHEELETETYLRSHDIKFEGYDFQGSDALAVFVDGKEIGNIAADKVQEVVEIAQKASGCTVTLALNGHDLEDYEMIVDQYKNRKEWKESDPFFDDEEAKENYDELMQSIKEEAIYSAVLHFHIKEESDDAPKATATQDTPKKESKKEPSAGLGYFQLILGIILLLMSLLLLLAVPVAGVIGALIAVFCIIYGRKQIKAAKENKLDNKQ